MTTRERLQLWKRRYATWGNLLRLVVVLIMLALAWRGLNLGWSYSGKNAQVWSRWEYFLVNLAPELAGIVIGVVLIDALNNWRQTDQLKAQLIRQMGSHIKDVAIPAVKELEHHAWLYDGSLKEANLIGANLEGVDLSGANLEGVDLTGSNLERAYLNRAHLEGADLTGAYLEDAHLSSAHLEGAYLDETHLEGADLCWAHLEGASLERAHLERAVLREVHLEMAWHLTPKHLRGASVIDGATMPDGIKLKNPFSLAFSGKVIIKPYLDGPTLEEWLATEPDCLNWEDEEE